MPGFQSSVTVFSKNFVTQHIVKGDEYYLNGTQENPDMQM